MILADPRGRATAMRIGGRITLDELLWRAALRRPDALAIVDPPNREAVVGGKPRSLTYKQAEHVVSAIAGRLRRMGLHTDGIVALQMANTVESLLTLLGVLRAGLIAMPLPALWRRSEMVAALSRVSPTALIVSGRMGTTDHYALAMQVAAEIFPIRYVCGYGAGAPDGLVPFDNLFDMGKLDPIPAWEEERAAEPGPTAHLAVITWDVGPCPGCTQSCRADRGRTRRDARKRAAAGLRAAVDLDVLFLCRPGDRDDSLAADRRHACAAPSL
jgi:hypothetical protein